MSTKINKIEKYKMLYGKLGIFLGIPAGLILGVMNIGIYFGPLIGLCIGMIIGRAKDKRISENIMIVRKIETINDLPDIRIYVSDKNQIEKIYKISNENMKKEILEEGDRVVEEVDSYLLSLESKNNTKKQRNLFMIVALYFSIECIRRFCQNGFNFDVAVLGILAILQFTKGGIIHRKL